MNDWKAQLAPGWSGINIALTIVLFLIAFPLGLLMLAYIIWGGRIGLDLGRPETFAREAKRLTGAFGAGREHWRSDANPNATGRPTPVVDRERDLDAGASRPAADLDGERSGTKH